MLCHLFMQLTELDYHLSTELIAQTPVEPRDASRLLCVSRRDCVMTHHRFADLQHMLQAGDVLIANDTSVINARLRGHKPSGGAAEVLLLRKIDALQWEALVGGRRVQEIVFANGIRASVTTPGGQGMQRIVTFNTPVDAYLDVLGEAPLPPYIHERLADSTRYQTVYARVSGSAAAPTAGLHFTPRLLDALRAKGVQVAFVTLHVGLDTFKPIETETVELHRIHSEWCMLPQATADLINRTKASGGRVIAVGTTSARVLESARLFLPEGGPLRAYSGDTRLFITPGFDFRVLDALITNFHLPRSSLLALVGALTGMDCLRAAYAEAIAERYRFFSFGDAMLIS
jgi:S-adenosylmethionine:tRNA ribosyltransferase-isomerase